MSMHKIKLTELERSGLEAHKLPIGTPSQNADCFRAGVAWALQNLAEHDAEVLSDFSKWLLKKYRCDLKDALAEYAQRIKDGE